MERIVISFLLLLIVACHKSVIKKDEISKVEIATSGCFGECPSINIAIDSNLNFKYYGGRYAKLQGYFTGKITRNFWDILDRQLEGINYRTLDTNYNVPVDASETELLISYNGHRKHIQIFLIKPDSTLKVINWLKNSYSQIKLTPCHDTIKFEASGRPKPKMQDVRIPPPLKKRYN